MSYKVPGMPTEQSPEVDVDEEGTPLHPEEAVLRSPGEGPRKRQEVRRGVATEEAATCEDVFCETKTVDESPLMKLSEEERQRLSQAGAAAGR